MCEFCNLAGAVAYGHSILVKDQPVNQPKIEVSPEPRSPGPHLPFDQRFGYEVVAECIPKSHIYPNEVLYDRLHKWAELAPAVLTKFNRTNVSYLVETVTNAVKREDFDRWNQLINLPAIEAAYKAVGQIPPDSFRLHTRPAAALGTFGSTFGLHWAFRHQVALAANLSMAALYNMSVPDNEKLCLRCVAEWRDGAECVGSKVNCGHVLWNPRYAEDRAGMGATCLHCSRSNQSLKTCTKCTATDEQNNAGTGAHHVTGGHVVCTTCCYHRECDTCHATFARRNGSGHPHCPTCCTCPMCPSCERTGQVMCLSGAKHCVGCCNCQHFHPVHTRDDLDWANEGGWQVRPFEPKDSQLKRNKLARLLGAELEIAGMFSQPKDFYKVCTKKWKARIMSDGSLPSNGFEMPTQPAGGDLWLDMIKEMTDTIAAGKGYVNQQCGTHLHVDTRDLDAQALYRVVKLYACVEPALYNVIHPQRSKNQYSAKCGQELLTLFSKFTKSANMADMETMFYATKVTVRTNEQTGKLEYSEGLGIGYVPADKLSRGLKESIEATKAHKGFMRRYRGLNLHSHFFRGTIEFRLHHGTVNGETITNWGLTLGSLVEWAKTHSEVDLLKLMSDTKEDPMLALSRVVVEVTGKNEMVDWLTQRAAAMKKYTKEVYFLGDR